MTPIKPNISVEYTENATVITFTERNILEEKNIRELEESIMSVIDGSKEIKLILDFCNVEFLSSAVLGLLIRISKKIYEQNGKLKLCSINSKIYKIFKITRLTKIFDICKDVENACEHMEAQE